MTLDKKRKVKHLTNRANFSKLNSNITGLRAEIEVIAKEVNLNTYQLAKLFDYIEGEK